MLEQLYEVSRYDVAKASTAPQRIVRHSDSTENLASIENTILTAVPADKVAVITGLANIGLRGAGAALVNTVGWRVQDSGGNVLYRPYRWRFSDAGLAAAPVELNYNWTGALILMPGEILIAIVDFDVANANNRQIASLTGYFAPRGNWQHG